MGGGGELGEKGIDTRREEDENLKRKVRGVDKMAFGRG